MSTARLLLPEWHPQDAVLLAWPHAATDWRPTLPSVTDVYLSLVVAIAPYEHVIIVTPEALDLELRLRDTLPELPPRIRIVELPTNDTWIRDYGPISILHDSLPTMLDFRFDGWGGKFRAELDNHATQDLFEQAVFNCAYQDCDDFTLEGGSIETDGRGTLLTTSSCLLNPNRNPQFSREEIEQRLGFDLGIRRVLWLHNGALAGDDTDGHIDMLARFTDARTIVYTSCRDPQYPYYAELLEMERELRHFSSLDGTPYSLVPLPLPTTVSDQPASYTNYLITNSSVLLPDYGDPDFPDIVGTMEKLFPGRAVVPVRANALITQGGSIHCATMQVPAGFLNNNLLPHTNLWHTSESA